MQYLILLDIFYQIWTLMDFETEMKVKVGQGGIKVE